MQNGRIVLAITLAAASFAAQAQSYRCVGTDGKKYYGSSIPPQCVGVMVEQMSPQGAVLRRIEPQGGTSAADRARKDAEEAERKKQAAVSREQQRRDQALLATYGSEKEVEDGRRRALENDQRVVRELEARIAALKQKRAGAKDSKVIDSELTLQENALAAKKKEIAAINAKYDEDKRRYLELTGSRK